MSEGMTWGQVAERILKMPDQIKEGMAEISCEPLESDPEHGIRYQGIILGIEDDGTNATASFVGEINQRRPQALT